MRRLMLVPLVACATAWGCLDATPEVDAPPPDEEVVAEAAQALSNGFNLSPTDYRSVRVNSGCSGTLIDPWWVLTARHCLPNDSGGDDDKDPARFTITLGTQTRDVTHVAIHPEWLDRVDVAMLRLESPFTNVTDEEMCIYNNDTASMIGGNVLCTGYGGTGSQLTGAYFTVVEDTVYGDPDQFYLLEPNETINPTASLVEGDSGSSCRMFGCVTGVHKGAGQVSVEVWGDWAIDRRDCPGFDPDAPSTGFCSTACPCDVGEGDCDSNDQCQPGLACVSAPASAGLPSGYDVCQRVNPVTCGAFNVNTPSTSFCRYDVEAGLLCACQHGQGDCDRDLDCGGSLECQEDSGYAVGLPSNYAICVYPAAPGCPSYDPDVDDASFCSTTCPCDVGQGDCDSDAECRGGLVCQAGIASYFGKPSTYSICVEP